MSNPRHCQNCGRVIPDPGYGPVEYARRKFCGRECTNAAGWNKAEHSESLFQELGGGNAVWMQTAARALLLAVLGCERLTASGCGAKYQKRKRGNDKNETGR